VTGGGGFLGRHIVARLLARGDRVRVYGRRRYPDLAEAGVDCRRGDLANPPLLQAACEGVDTVFHLASLADIWGSRKLFHQTNVQGTLNAVAAASGAGVGRFVYCSTPSVVYRGPISGGDESLPYPDRHLCVYAETKAQAERVVLGANHPSFLTCALRPHLIWGPGDTHVIPTVIDRARHGRLWRIGDGRNRISISYVEDVAAAHLAAADCLAPGHPAAGQAYFIVDDEPVNCWDFIDEVLAMAGAPPVRRRLPVGLAGAVGAVMEFWCGLAGSRRAPVMTRFLASQLGTEHWFSNGRAKRDLGWAPAVDRREGLRRMFAQADAAARPARKNGHMSPAKANDPRERKNEAGAGKGRPAQTAGGTLDHVAAARGHAAPNADELLARREAARLSGAGPGKTEARTKNSPLKWIALLVAALLGFLAVWTMHGMLAGPWSPLKP